MRDEGSCGGQCKAHTLPTLLQGTQGSQISLRGGHRITNPLKPTSTSSSGCQENTANETWKERSKEDLVWGFALPLHSHEWVFIWILCGDPPELSLGEKEEDRPRRRTSCPIHSHMPLESEACQWKWPPRGSSPQRHQSLSPQAPHQIFL